MRQLTAVSPANGAPIGSYPIADAATVLAAVERGRAAAVAWGAESLSARLHRLRRLRRLMAASLDEILQVLSSATARPRLESLTGDVLVTLEMIRYYERHAGRALRRERRGHPLLFLPSSFWVEYEPLGVVAVISPWNYPLQLSLVPMAAALAAGNAVILKPSELTPSVGALIERLCRSAGIPADLVQVVYGDGAVGAALVEAGPDKIVFTGGVGAGRAVARAAGERLIPAVLELGGKDPMIVFADADVDRAARAAVYGAFANAGQACVSVERLYVERGLHDRLVERIRREATLIRVAADGRGDIGPLIRPGQALLVDEQVRDAVSRGARVVCGGGGTGACRTPCVLADVTHEMCVMRQETFGPVLPIMAFDTEDEAVTLANDSPCGLNASVWTADARRGLRVARRLCVGNCAINDVLINIANPFVPFGGEKCSGIGRCHGPEGLRAMCRVKSVMRRRRPFWQPNWFPYTPETARAVSALIQVRHGAGGRGRALAELCEAAWRLWRCRR